MTNNDMVKVVNADEPMRHQLGKFVAGTLVGFAASSLTEKLYDIALKAYRQKRSTVK